LNTGYSSFFSEGIVAFGFISLICVYANEIIEAGNMLAKLVV